MALSSTPSNTCLAVKGQPDTLLWREVLAFLAETFFWGFLLVFAGFLLATAAELIPDNEVAQQQVWGLALVLAVFAGVDMIRTFVRQFQKA